MITISRWYYDTRDWMRRNVGRAARWVAWSPWRLAAVVGLIVIGLIVVVQLRAAPPGPAASRSSTPTAEPSWPTATAGTNTPSQTPTPSSASPSEDVPISSAHFTGDQLGHAWIKGFLTRSTPDDDHWHQMIEHISTPELIDKLDADGPDKLAITLPGPWRVTKISHYEPSDSAVDTPSRVTLPYLVTISNGTATQQKRFVLTAYLGEVGWQVGVAAQPGKG